MIPHNFSIFFLTEKYFITSRGQNKSVLYTTKGSTTKKEREREREEREREREEMEENERGRASVTNEVGEGNKVYT